MTTPDAATGRRPGLGAAIANVREHATKLAGLELELATLELKQKLAALGAGVGLLVGAGVVGLYVLGFLLLTIAAALATTMSAWLALLIVTLFLLLVVVVLVLVGLRQVRKGSPPVPAQAIAEAKLTSEALKSDG
jgi:hypothetical protein